MMIMAKKDLCDNIVYVANAVDTVLKQYGVKHQSLMSSLACRIHNPLSTLRINIWFLSSRQNKSSIIFVSFQKALVNAVLRCYAYKMFNNYELAFKVGQAFRRIL